MGFDPNKYIMQLKGKKYLETRYRIVWFREEHPRGGIDTEVISLDPVLVKATVMAEGGEVLARAHAGAKSQPNSVWAGREIEKAETAAIGRALAHAGYGTQFADEYSPDEIETGHLADSPTEQRQPPVSRGGDNGKPVGGMFNIRHMKVLAQRGRDGKPYYQCVMERNMGDPIVFTGAEPFRKSGLFTDEQIADWKLKGEVEFNPELRVKWDGKTVEILGVVGEAVAS